MKIIRESVEINKEDCESFKSGGDNMVGACCYTGACCKSC